MKLVVEFNCGHFSSKEEFPDGATEDEVQENFDVWLSNRTDIGWSIIKGELTPDPPEAT